MNRNKKEKTIPQTESFIFMTESALQLSRESIWKGNGGMQ